MTNSGVHEIVNRGRQLCGRPVTPHSTPPCWILSTSKGIAGTAENIMT